MGVYSVNFTEMLISYLSISKKHSLCHVSEREKLAYFSRLCIC